jgi:hypothetical protein
MFGFWPLGVDVVDEDKFGFAETDGCECRRIGDRSASRIAREDATRKMLNDVEVVWRRLVE